MQVFNLLLQDYGRYTCEIEKALDKSQYICLSRQFMVEVLLIYTTDAKVLTVVPQNALQSCGSCTAIRRSPAPSISF